MSAYKRVFLIFVHVICCYAWNSGLGMSVIDLTEEPDASEHAVKQDDKKIPTRRVQVMLNRKQEAIHELCTRYLWQLQRKNNYDTGNSDVLVEQVTDDFLAILACTQAQLIFAIHLVMHVTYSKPVRFGRLYESWFREPNDIVYEDQCARFILHDLLSCFRTIDTVIVQNIDDKSVHELSNYIVESLFVIHEALANTFAARPSVCTDEEKELGIVEPSSAAALSEHKREQLLQARILYDHIAAHYTKTQEFTVKKITEKAYDFDITAAQLSLLVQLNDDLFSQVFSRDMTKLLLKSPLSSKCPQCRLPRMPGLCQNPDSDNSEPCSCSVCLRELCSCSVIKGYLAVDYNKDLMRKLLDQESCGILDGVLSSRFNRFIKEPLVWEHEYPHTINAITKTMLTGSIVPTDHENSLAESVHCSDITNLVSRGQELMGQLLALNRPKDCIHCIQSDIAFVKKMLDLKVPASQKDLFAWVRKVIQTCDPVTIKDLCMVVNVNLTQCEKGEESPVTLLGMIVDRLFHDQSTEELLSLDDITYITNARAYAQIILFLIELGVKYVPDENHDSFLAMSVTQSHQAMLQIMRKKTLVDDFVQYVDLVLIKLLPYEERAAHITKIREIYPNFEIDEGFWDNTKPDAL